MAEGAEKQSGSEALNLNTGFIDNVLATGQAKTLRLFLTNASGQPIVMSGSQPWLTLDLTPGNSAGALNTASVIGQLSIAPSQANWTVSAPTASRPNWRLIPQNGNFPATGSGATVAFDIANVVAKIPGITNATIRYGGSSKLASGSFTLPIVKLVPPPAPTISYFTVSPDTVDLTASSGNAVIVRFKTGNAQQVLIDGAGYLAAGGSGAVTFSFAAWNTAKLRLIATGAQGQVATQSIDLTVTPPLSNQVPDQAVVLWNQQSAPSFPGFTPVSSGAAIGNFVMGGGATSSKGSATSPVAGASGSGGGHSHKVPVVALKTTSGNQHKHGFSVSRSGSHFSGACSWNGQHNHSVSTLPTVETGTAATPNPPWYALAFIIKDY